MHQTELHLRLWIDRLDGFGEALQAILLSVGQELNLQGQLHARDYNLYRRILSIPNLGGLRVWRFLPAINRRGIRAAAVA